MKTVSAIALAVVAGTATAEIVSHNSGVNFQNVQNQVVTTDIYGNTVDVPVNPQVLGDTVNAAVTGFNTAGGAFLAGPGTHTVGGSDVLASASAGLIDDVVISTTVTTVGTTRTIDIFMLAAGGYNIADAAITLSGISVESLFFEVPDINGGPDLFDDAAKIGAASGSFDLIGADASGNLFSLFATTAGVDDLGTSFSVGNGVGVGSGGNILGSFGASTIDGSDVFVTGGIFSISYEVPAPSSAGILALGGLAATRRRR